ncbi:flippase [Psychrobacter communis]|uniref:Flippase n=1 Tax=Psychrobacter communis TaxID=2762238 RepID=A0ABR8RJG6_9GAMM|nr:flippase [Psychrobacter communis]MBD7947948.1 flippase [Psychrobacter communis]
MINKVKALIGRVNKSKDGKVLASNFGYLMLLQIAGYIFPLITIPYLARVIGVEGFGKIAFAAAVVVWFQTVADWGFKYTATRDVARNRDDLEKVSEIFSNVLWARIVLMLLSFTLLIIAIATIPYFKENQSILLITFLLVPGHILFPDWFFQAMERMRFITIFNLGSKALFTALVFVFIKEKTDFILQPLFITLGYAVSGLFSMYIVVAKWKVKILPPKPTAIYSTINSSTDVFINNIMPNLYNSFSIVLLGFYGGSVSTGLLDAGSKFIGIFQQFITVISRVFFPFLSRRSEKHNILVKINLSVSIAASVILFSLAPIIIKIFFTEEFYQAIPILQIMSVSIIFLSLSNVYGLNYLIIHGYEKDLRNITFIVSFIGFVLSFPLVYFYDFIGAAIIITLTRGILGLSIMYKARTIIKGKVTA